MNYKNLVYGVAVGEAVALPYQYTERGTFKCGGYGWFWHVATARGYMVTAY